MVCAPQLELRPLYPKIRDMLQNGSWGPVYTVHGPFLGWAGYNLGHGSDPKWCFSRGSGPLRDQGVYSLTAMISMLGPVVRVGAMGNIRSPKLAWNGVEFDVDELDNLSLTLEFENGALGTLAESWCSTSDNSTAFRINAFEGVIEGGAKFAGYHGIFPLEATLRRNGRETELWRIDPDSIPFLNGEHATLWNPHIWADIRHLCLAIRGEEALVPNGETARHVVQIIEAAHLSAAENRFISLSRLWLSRTGSARNQRSV